MKRAIFVVALYSCTLACTAQPAQQSTTVSASTSITVQPGTPEHSGVIEWLRQRQREGQYVDGPSPVGMDLNNVTTPLTISNTRPLRNAIGSSVGGRADLILPDPLPGQLPPTGTPGETYVITSCKTGGTSYTYTYAWDPAANGGQGGWVIVKVVYQQRNSVCDNL